MIPSYCCAGGGGKHVAISNAYRRLPSEAWMGRVVVVL